MDDSLVQALDPIKKSWQKADCFPPCQFASPSVFCRAFDELLLCKNMDIGSMCKVPRTFLSLGGVRRCHTVRMAAAIGHLDADDVAAWLHLRQQARHVSMTECHQPQRVREVARRRPQKGTLAL